MKYCTLFMRTLLIITNINECGFYLRIVFVDIHLTIDNP